MSVIFKARAQMEKEKNEFEVVDYMMKQFTNTVYSFIPATFTSKKKRGFLFVFSFT